MSLIDPQVREQPSKETTAKQIARRIIKRELEAEEARLARSFRRAVGNSID